jgi:hypothetical protein
MTMMPAEPGCRTKNWKRLELAAADYNGQQSAAAVSTADCKDYRSFFNWLLSVWSTINTQLRRNVLGGPDLVGELVDWYGVL